MKDPMRTAKHSCRVVRLDEYEVWDDSRADRITKRWERVDESKSYGTFGRRTGYGITDPGPEDDEASVRLSHKKPSEMRYKWHN